MKKKLVNTKHMERNQIESSKFFETYVVDDTPENWKKYAAVITDIEFFHAKELSGDYHCRLSFAYKSGRAVMVCRMVYRNVMTIGRTEFQEFIEEFDLLVKNGEDSRLLDFKKLQKAYCVVSLNSIGTLKRISSVYLEGTEEEKKIADFFDQSVKIAHPENFRRIPDEILFYCVIPATHPDDVYLPNFEYCACIRDVACTKSRREGDIDVKVSAYVFNGGTTKVIAKFYNQIYSAGKAEFDDFCTVHGFVRDDGTIDFERMRGRLCKAILYENRKGNLYIDSLEPLEDIYDVDIIHYKTLIRAYKINHKHK